MKIGNRWISLNALNTFEAAARHGHMGRAAMELNVTQSAVSHQVKGLEGALGVHLFERQGRNIRITRAGRQLMRAVQEGFDAISSIALSIQQDEFAQELTIMAPVSLMTEWLTRKLAAFLELYPQLTLNCRIAERDMTTIPADVDVAIIYNQAKFDGRVVSPLIAVRMFPVCAPQLVSGPLPLSPEILHEETLIHEDDGATWRRWFAAKGLESATPRRDIFAGSFHDAMGFARCGAGYAITDWFLGRRDIVAGSLVQPFGSEEVDLSHYYIVTRREDPPGHPASEFAKWLDREVGNTEFSRGTTASSG